MAREKITSGQSTPDDFPTPPPAGAGVANGPDFVLIQIVRLAQDTGALSTRLGSLETTTSNIQRLIEKLEPQINKVVGFIDHSQPHLATKADISALESKLNGKIDDRPSKTWILTWACIVLAVVALPFWPDWWTHVKSYFPH